MGPAVAVLEQPAEVSGSRAVEFAGRQRMLAQRYVKELLLECLGAPSDTSLTLELLQETAAALAHGGLVHDGDQALLLPPAPDRDVAELLARQSELVEKLCDAGEKLRQHGSSWRALQLVDSSLETFHATAHRATVAYARAIAERQARRAVALEKDLEVLEGQLAALRSGATRSHTAAETLGDLAEGTAETGQHLQRTSDTLASSTSHVRSGSESLGRSAAQLAQATVAMSADASAAQKALHALTRQAESIRSVTRLIRDVARQTNLLSLNAAIEAARAGAAGRGFAVVAAEVRDLARQAGSATRDIESSLKELAAAASETSGMVDAFAERSDVLRETSERVAFAAQEQEAGILEIDHEASRLAGLAEGAGRSVVELRRAADTAGTTADSLGTVADELDATRGSLRRLLESYAG